MNKLNCLLLSTLLTITVFSQDRLTNFQSDGSNQDNYVRVYDGESYFISVTQDDIVSVYSLSSTTQKILLHTTILQGLYNTEGSELDLTFLGKSMIFGNSQGLVEYNFIDDVTIVSELAEGFSYGQLYAIDEQALRMSIGLRNEDRTQSKNIIYTLGGAINELTEARAVFNLYGDNICNYRFDRNSDTHTHYFKDYIRNITDTVTFNLPFTQNPFQVGESILYFDDEGQVQSFDTETRTSQPIPNLKLEYDDFNESSNIILGDENHLLLMTSQRDTNTIQIYNAATYSHHLTLGFNVDEHIFIFEKSLNDGVLTVLMDDELLIIDLQTGNYMIRPTYYYWVGGFEVLEDKYIINPYLITNFPERVHGFELIDIQNQTIQEVSGEYNIDFPYSIGYAKFGNEYLVGYNYNSRDHCKLFNINLDSFSSEKNLVLDETAFGLSADAELFKVGKEIYLLGPSLYKVNLQTFQLEEIISKEELQEVKSRHVNIKDGKITFVQEEPKRILSYDGERIIEEADLTNFTGSFFSNIVSDYAIIDDYVMLFDGIKEGYLYTKSNKEIDKIDIRLIGLPEILFSYNNKIYYSEFDDLSVFDGLNTELVLDDHVGGVFSFRESAVIFKNQILTINSEGMVRINEDNSATQIGSSFEPNFVDDIYVAKSGEHLITGNSNKRIHYDGIQASEFQSISEDFRIGVKPSNDNIFFLNEIESGLNVQTFYNSESKLYGRLPDEIQSHRVVDYFESRNESFLLTTSGAYPILQLNIYKTDSHFINLELVDEYLDVGNITEATFSRFYNEGFLYSRDLLFLMDEDNNFIELANLSGTNITQVEENAGDLFFIASDPQLGRQLYTLRLLSFRVSTDDHEDGDLAIRVYPNPSHDEIQIESELSLQSGSYKIYNSEGKLMDTGTLNQKINISQLQSGIYHLQYQKANRTATANFVKL